MESSATGTPWPASENADCCAAGTATLTAPATMAGSVSSSVTSSAICSDGGSGAVPCSDGKTSGTNSPVSV